MLVLDTILLSIVFSSFSDLQEWLFVAFGGGKREGG